MITTRHLFRLWAFLLALVALSGCSDSSGDGSATPPKSWSVTATAGAGGTITPAAQTVVDGARATFTITPEANFSISAVSGCNGTLEGTTFTTEPIFAPCTVSVSFTEGPPPVLYTIDVSSAPAAGGLVSGGGVYGDGVEVTVTAVPNATYGFMRWEEDGQTVSSDASYSFSATTNRQLVAHFALATYTVSATAGANGSVTPTEQAVEHGGKATITVTPDTGYSIASVTGCSGTLTGNTYTTGAVTAACDITASFSLNSYTVTASAGTGGAISPGSRSVDHGSTTTFTVTPDTGYSTVSVIGCDGTLEGNTYTTGAITGDCAVSATFQVQTVSPLYPLNGANWNDYVVNDGNMWNALDNACTGEETGGYSACIHGGERRVYNVPSYISCADLTATDTLGVFDWRCDDSQGHVRFLSTNLRGDKDLSDLIDFNAAAWKDNALTVKNGAETVATSPSTKWWSNPLVIANDGLATATAGTIYLVTTNAQGYYILNADKVGLVIKPGVTLTGLAANSWSNVVHVYDHTNWLRRFAWIEGAINASGDSVGIRMEYTSFSVLRSVKVMNAVSVGIDLSQSSNNSVMRVIASNNKWAGMALSDASNNFIYGVITSGAGQRGFDISSSVDNVIVGVTATNNKNYGVLAYQTNHNIFSGIAAGNNDFSNSVGGSGLLINMSPNNTFANLALAHNAHGVRTMDSSFNRFTGLLRVGTNVVYDCDVLSGGTDPGLKTVTCENQGSSDATLTQGITLALAFKGQVFEDDAVNASDTDGTATYPANPVTFDWTNFSNEFRGWGMNGSGFPNADHADTWTTGTGRIWDWSLRGGDLAIRGVHGLPTGNTTAAHTWSDGTTTTFLRNAVELQGDGDGLCESDETCLYTPNIGAYQGHGALISAGTFTNGTISNVTLLKYETNGR